MVIYFIALFVLIALVVFALGLSWDSGNERVRQLKLRLEMVEQAERREPRASLALLRDDLLSEIPALNQWLSTMGRTAELQRWLRQAAIPMRPGKLVLISVACGVFGAMTAGLGLPWYGIVLCGLGGAGLPWLWVAQRRKKRLALFQAQFPEAIELLVRASRAGHPPGAALELIATEMPEPIAGEFRQVFDQQRFGLPLRDCLLNLAQRIPLVDVQFFAIAVIIQRESGGNLAEILEKLSGLIRERVKILRQVKTHTAQGRMTMWVLVALAPAMLVAMLLISHAFVMPLFTDPMGQAMLGLGAVLQIVGLLLLNRIVDIKV